jgi:lipopolysaccharide export system permease protein
MKGSMNTIINRYILREISFPFFMTLLVFTFVLIIGKILQIMDLMVNKGVLFISILKMILFTMHAFLIFTIPISLLIAILIGLGRLSGDNEITVMKSSGVSLYQLFVPIAFMSVLAFVFSLTIGLLAPLSNFAMKNLLFDIVKQKASIGIKEKVFNDDFKGLVIYADRIPLEGDFMEGVMVNDTRLVKEPTTIIAPRGYLRSDLKSMKVILRLERGSIHSVESGLKTYKKTDFGSYDVLLDMGTALSESAQSTSKGSVDMTIRELLENIRKGGIDEATRRDMIIELNKKFSIPLSCLVFAIIGIPLGIMSRRSGKSRGFAVGLFVVTIYYTLQLAGEALGETGKLPPVLAVWAPNILVGSLGAYLFLMAAKEKPFPDILPLVWVERIADKWRRIRS